MTAEAGKSLESEIAESLESESTEIVFDGVRVCIGRDKLSSTIAVRCAELLA